MAFRFGRTNNLAAYGLTLMLFVSSGVQAQQGQSQRPSQPWYMDYNNTELKSYERESAPDENRTELKSYERESVPDENRTELKSYERESVPDENRTELKSYEDD